MIIFLLIIIAVGVLLISEPGQALLAFFIGWGIRLAILAVIVIGLISGYLYVTSKKQEVVTPVKNEVKVGNTSPISDYSQKPETKDDIFPMTSNTCDASGCPQYEWYDRHNVPMAYRCYPGGCDEEQWRKAIYNGGADTNVISLYTQSQKQAEIYKAQFPKEKCVTESDVTICDLSYNVISKNNDQRTIKMEGNEIACVGPVTGYKNQIRSNTIVVADNEVYCASDFGSIYIDPTIEVTKYFNTIKRDNYTSPYYVPNKYSKCIWTYADGNGAVPYIDILGSTGPSSGFNVRAYCSNGVNQVDIYSYKE